MTSPGPVDAVELGKPAAAQIHPRKPDVLEHVVVEIEKLAPGPLPLQVPRHSIDHAADEVADRVDGRASCVCAGKDVIEASAGREM